MRLTKEEKARRDINKAHRERWQYYREHNICPQCGTEWSEPGRALCNKCMAIKREQYAARESENGGLQAIIKRQRREDRKKNHLCIDCGKPTNSEHVRCEKCLEKRRDSNHKFDFYNRLDRQAEQARKRGKE